MGLFDRLRKRDASPAAPRSLDADASRSDARRRRDVVRAYHRATKHHLHRYAPGPAGLDWANQPDPFRRYEGAPLVALALPPARGAASYDTVQRGLALAAAPPSPASMSELFYDSLALSAWKAIDDARWALRVTPSSGNLHPLEAYVACGGEWGLDARAALWHYAPREHALELLARYDDASWSAALAELPARSCIVAFSAITWREAWKYGERAWRYDELDLGHAAAALGYAAAAQGWSVRALAQPESRVLEAWLRLARTHGPERERPALLCALVPAASVADVGAAARAFAAQHGDRLPAARVERLVALGTHGVPNELSSEHVEWPAIEALAEAFADESPLDACAQADAEVAAGADAEAAAEPRATRAGLQPLDPALAASALDWRSLARSRRSAVEMDARTTLAKSSFVRMLHACLPREGHAAFALCGERARAQLVLFAHRVDGLGPGLYLLARRANAVAALRALCRPDFAWSAVDDVGELDLYLLSPGDVRGLAATLACGQSIAANGCFAVALLCEFAAAIERGGARAYAELFHECGALGQVLYLEAAAHGISATGIGCFFDDALHAALGLRGEAWQCLYQFTVGGAVEDKRLSTLPAYPAPRAEREPT